MKQQTRDMLERALDIETELTDEIEDAVGWVEFLHDRVNAGAPMTPPELVLALVKGRYDPRKRIAEAMSPKAKAVHEEVLDTLAPEKRKGRPAGSKNKPKSEISKQVEDEIKRNALAKVGFGG